ncbi:hypothetical protein AOLI_G00072570 [Acnodon oligacanthus]
MISPNQPSLSPFDCGQLSRRPKCSSTPPLELAPNIPKPAVRSGAQNNSSGSYPSYSTKYWSKLMGLIPEGKVFCGKPDLLPQPKQGSQALLAVSSSFLDSSMGPLPHSLALLHEQKGCKDFNFHFPLGEYGRRIPKLTLKERHPQQGVP